MQGAQLIGTNSGRWSTTLMKGSDGFRLMSKHLVILIENIKVTPFNAYKSIFWRGMFCFSKCWYFDSIWDKQISVFRSALISLLPWSWSNTVFYSSAGALVFRGFLSSTVVWLLLGSAFFMLLNNTEVAKIHSWFPLSFRACLHYRDYAVEAL